MQSIDEWHGRLHTDVPAKGGHFEQLLWQYSATWQETFQFLSNVSRFFIVFFLEITTISYFWISQGSAETCWKYGGKYYMGFAGNLLGFPAVKEFWKSVKNWQSYCHEFGVQYFLNSHRRSQYGLHLVCVMYPIIQAIWVDNRGQLG